MTSRRYVSILLGALAFLALHVGSRAELVWTQPIQSLQPPAGALEVTAYFECINAGSKTIRLLEVRSGCGCTAAALDKNILQPGEKTRIAAVFHAGERRGHQQVDISVLTDESPGKTYSLLLAVDLKEFALLTPRNLAWSVGDAGGAKILKVSLKEGFAFISATSATSDFRVEVISSNENEAALRVQPQDTWAKRVGSIEVVVGKGGGSSETAKVQAVLRVN